MQLTRLQLTQFRSYESATFEFDPLLTAIVGPNGSGKTNILEAIYTVCIGKSFRDSDDELLTYDTEWWKIEAQIDDLHREVRFQPSHKGKQLLIDGTLKGRFTYRQQLPAVLFEPDDLLMLHGSPSARRRYIDDIIQRVYPQTRTIFSRYERVITQRNTLLKQRLPLEQLKDALFVWDVSAADLGAKIISARQELLAVFNQTLSTIYSEIAHKSQELSAIYIPPEQTESQLLSALHTRLQDDIQRGYTTVGPHRHDIEFELNKKSAKQAASRGEVRSIVLSLKVLELRLMEAVLGQTPLLLLDDVMSELDSTRQTYLIKANHSQTIITSTHPINGVEREIKLH